MVELALLELITLLLTHRIYSDINKSTYRMPLPAVFERAFIAVLVLPLKDFIVMDLTLGFRHPYQRQGACFVIALHETQLYFSFAQQTSSWHDC